MLCKDILSFHPSIKTSLHILDHTIKPVLLYGSEIWGKFNPHSSRFRNGISIDNIYNLSEPDKLHLKFCKFILGVHKKSSNFAVMSELGRVPYYINIIKSMLLYWHRLENSVNNSLLYNAFTNSKALSTCRDSWFFLYT